MQDHRRRGTRVKCEISVTLELLDLPHLPPGPSLIMVVNPQGCCARFGRQLEIGNRVRLEGLPVSRSVTALVVHCTSLGEYEKFWLLGLALDEPGNVWGIETPPEDWRIYPPPSRS